jgi:predicted amidophosphoribosyltransferase
MGEFLLVVLGLLVLWDFLQNTGRCTRCKRPNDPYTKCCPVCGPEFR